MMRLVTWLLVAVPAAGFLLAPRPSSLVPVAAQAKSELEELRAENERLKQELEAIRPTQELDTARGLSEPFRGLMPWRRSNTFADAFSELSLFDGSAKDDVDLVLRAVQQKLDSRLPNATIQRPTQQSYSSSNINGNITKKVALVARATSGDQSALVNVLAALDADGNVTIETLKLDDDDILVDQATPVVNV
eukprot:CAMPEP_0197394750 /NCGR_PEP_ID=MMETSP1165-20131217/5968_1 /TAXON_ID=284809 /ORGANISM="Chrysocystis fragilis, Strain CCMP3189" /LENGTH=191 /DNA_ID=CAMNT_0042920483 /DNA_START=36 /DNA_END=611 /DNA_ORIENTATION=+